MDKLSKILTNMEEVEDANNNEPNTCPSDADFSTVLVQVNIILFGVFYAKKKQPKKQ